MLTQWPYTVCPPGKESVNGEQCSLGDDILTSSVPRACWCVLSPLDSCNGFIWRLWRFIGYLEKWHSRVSSTTQEGKKKSKELTKWLLFIRAVKVRCLKISQKAAWMIKSSNSGDGWRPFESLHSLFLWEDSPPFPPQWLRANPWYGQTLLNRWLTIRLLIVRSTSSRLSLRLCASTFWKRSPVLSYDCEKY